MYVELCHTQPMTALHLRLYQTTWKLPCSQEWPHPSTGRHSKSSCHNIYSSYFVKIYSLYQSAPKDQLNQVFHSFLWFSSHILLVFYPVLHENYVREKVKQAEKLNQKMMMVMWVTLVCDGVHDGVCDCVHHDGAWWCGIDELFSWLKTYNFILVIF